MNYRDFYSYLTERIVDKFENLPQKPPYGFLIYRNGTFGIANEWGTHSELVEDEDISVTKIIKEGGIRVALTPSGEEYVAEYLPIYATNQAKRTAKDLTDYYGVTLSFENISKWIGKELGENKSPVSEEYPTMWNKDEFEKINSFAKKLRYAASHLTKLASGSGRSVFKIDEQKVLKIAKNKKGLAQNAVEAESFLQQYQIVARVFDSDDRYFKELGPFWVEMELAKKISRKHFETLVGVSIDNLEWYLREHREENRSRKYFNSMPSNLKKEIDNNEFVIELMSLNADYDMATGDQGRLSTWGEVLRDGKPRVVMVDFGLTTSVFDDFYKVKFR